MLAQHHMPLPPPVDGGAWPPLWPAELLRAAHTLELAAEALTRTLDSLHLFWYGAAAGGLAVAALASVGAIVLSRYLRR